MIRKFLFFIFILISVFTLKGQEAIYSDEAIHHPVVAKNGMVASQHKLASEAGIAILKKGGNAIDAAVAVGFSLAVVLPRAGNIGGGGFMLIHLAKADQTVAINYRETAPQQATSTMYIDEKGDVNSELYNQSYQSIGIPGTVAGLALALEKYGTMSLAEVLAPAIELAEKGFPISYDLMRKLIRFETRLKACSESAKIFFKKDAYYEAGDVLVQKDLAWSLKQIARDGKDAFYTGEIAKRLVNGIQKNGGLLTREDFRNYKAKTIAPVWGEYKGYEIASMPPPSSGGIHLIQILNILEDFPLRYLGHNSAETIHIMAEAMRLAYADRSKFLGDPDFVDVPEEGIISKEYAAELGQKINRYAANKSSDIRPGNPYDFEGPETTHFSVADAAGNLVSNTFTLNFSFGTGLIAEGTGILLNNEMGDFSAKPGAPDAYGLIGGTANAIQAGKRPLSSMTPTLVFKDGKAFLATGSPGGSRIITSVLQLILNVIEHDMNIAEASHVPRVHHQWYPDVLFYEKGISYDTRLILKSKGHTLEQKSSLGSNQSIMIKNGRFYGSSDPRRPDATTLGF